MSLWTQAKNPKLKQNALIQDANGMQFFSVFYKTQFEAISQQ